ncbi:MAG: 4-(cytidine 5'-diphospho)-2-C-methyl-D-erythritol kinase [Campylobacteraceae bacterium]|nr:4-(cytidine 5'-diphospho)-2-C-methyl-D-erythritol kinase [Campylobacteraceae bacterium]
MKSYAKLNVFLKIVGTRGNFHEINSRFILHKELFDEIEFVESGENNGLKIISNIEISGENIIQKAYSELAKFSGGVYKETLKEYFKNHAVKLTKNIPMGAGLGGGSSNAGAFLNLTNQTLNLGISKQDLVKISEFIGSDVAFFTSGLTSANVSGLGEIVESFDDDIPSLEIKTPDIFASTPQIYQTFRANFMDKINPSLAKELLSLSSKEILENYKNYELNDLLYPFQKLNPEFKLKESEFLSGSGSSYFYIKGKN